ncbi:hypothetical protein FLAV_02185 [Flavobacteriales bacterium]|nr:hypothetical protein FLAV_02185 [Flavobacteriales bacterium]
MWNKKIYRIIRNWIGQFGKILFIPITLFFIFLSVVCLYLAFRDYCSDSDFTVFLNNINKYGNIFTITIALVTVFLILNQIALALEANKLTPKTKWIENFDSHLKELKEDKTSQQISAMIHKYFQRNAEDIFDFLYGLELTMRVNNEKELADFFNVFLKDKVREFELDSNGYHQNNKSYKSLDTSYSITDIQKILPYLLKPTRSYQTLESDFAKLYKNEVTKMIQENELKK